MIRMALRRLWSRLVGLKGWNEEASMLHNVEGDGKPPPGATEATVIGDRRPGVVEPENPKQKYEEWPGKDPGH